MFVFLMRELSRDTGQTQFVRGWGRAFRAGLGQTERREPPVLLPPRERRETLEVRSVCFLNPGNNKQKYVNKYHAAIENNPPSPKLNKACRY